MRLGFPHWFHHIPVGACSLHGITSSAVREPVFQTLVLPPPSVAHTCLPVRQTLALWPPHKNHSSDTGTIPANNLDSAPKETRPIKTSPMGGRKIRMTMTFAIKGFQSPCCHGYPCGHPEDPGKLHQSQETELPRDYSTVPSQEPKVPCPI